MADIYTSLAAVLKGMEETLKANGFEAVALKVEAIAVRES